MFDPKQALFDNAVEKLLSDDIHSFYKMIKELYDVHMTCNCFFKSQPVTLWDSLRIKVDKKWGFCSAGYIKFIQGFIYLRSGPNFREKAYKELTRAISSDPYSDIAFSLRATIDDKFRATIERAFLFDNNASELDDAQKAVILNPSARNYFVLAIILNEKNQPEYAIKCFEKVISLNNKFDCAYSWMGYIYATLKDYNNAIINYVKCIEVNPNHEGYYNLAHCLIEKFEGKLISGFNKKKYEKEYREALYYLELGHTKHPDNIKYHSALGKVYSALSMHEQAVKHYELYLEHNPKNFQIKNDLDASKRNLALKDAISSYDYKDYEASISKIEILARTSSLSDDTLKKYYDSLLKFYKLDIDLNESNGNYARLNALKNNYVIKTAKGENCSEDEENANKLKVYSPNDKIGFGNYEKLTIQEIIQKDPSYILWCIINLHHFSIDENLFLKITHTKDNEFLKAIEINVVKNKLVKKWKEIERQKEREREEYEGNNDEPSDNCPDYFEWLEDEFGDDAETAYWNMD